MHSMTLVNLRELNNPSATFCAHTFLAFSDGLHIAQIELQKDGSYWVWVHGEKYDRFEQNAPFKICSGDEPIMVRGYYMPFHHSVAIADMLDQSRLWMKNDQLWIDLGAHLTDFMRQMDQWVYRVMDETIVRIDDPSIAEAIMQSTAAWRSDRQQEVTRTLMEINYARPPSDR